MVHVIAQTKRDRITSLLSDFVPRRASEIAVELGLPRTADSIAPDLRRLEADGRVKRIYGRGVMSWVLIP